jgi:hypothetical protein
MKTIIVNVKKLALALILVIGIGAFANAQVKTALKTADLQKGITDQISQNYVGYAIKNAYKVDHNKVITYQVNVEKDKKVLCLSYDSSGKFLNAIEPKNKTNTTHKSTAMNDKSYPKK